MREYVLAGETKAQRRYRLHGPELRRQRIEYCERHRERLKAKRHTPEYRAKRASYARVYVLCRRIFEEWQMRTWMTSRRAA